MKNFLFALLLASLAACSKTPPAATRPVKFYQSPMHPWITSDHPGNCTICGMALVPVYEGDAGSSPAAPSDLITLQDASLRVLGVATVPARRMELTRSLRFSGIFEDDDTTHRLVAAFYDGRIERVYIDHVGEYVKKGQPLAAIYSPELLYVVREFQTAVKNASANILSTSARRLVQYGLSPEQVEALGRQKEPAYTIDLLAPADGTVLVRKAYQGQYIKTGEPLFEIGSLSHLWFHAEVYERDLPDVKLGQKATLTTPTVPGREFPGVVTFIDPNFDPATRSTKVRIEVNNPLVDQNEPGMRYVLPHRAYAEASIAASLGEVLVVPRSAVLRDGSRSVVYVQKAPGQFEPRPVKVGRVGDEGIEILEGLTENEPVVAAGNLLIDAEAQLRGDVTKAEPHPPHAVTIPAGASAFLAQLSKVSASLAAEDTVATTAAARSLPSLAAAITGDPDNAALRDLQALTTPPQGEDLRALRKNFLPWSQAGAALATELRQHGADAGVRVFECPMTSGSFPGAPARARWVQTGADTRNPYLGAAMLTCGEEVRP